MVISALIGFLYGIYVMARHKEPVSVLLPLTLMAGIFGVCWSVIVMMVSSHVVAVETQIVAIQDEQSASGQFFLGSGSIDSEPVFFFYKKTGRDSYRLDHISADNSTIVESDETPKMVQECRIMDASILIWPIPSEASVDCHGGVTTKFYVPKGSIQNNYMLDAQ